MGYPGESKLMTTIAAIIGTMSAIILMLALAWHFVTRNVDTYLRQWHRPDYDEWTKGMYE